ncbi:MAG: mechanosensitive ion channel family protein [Planctomycetota bacterium]
MATATPDRRKADRHPGAGVPMSSPAQLRWMPNDILVAKPRLIPGVHSFVPRPVALPWVATLILGLWTWCGSASAQIKHLDGAADTSSPRATLVSFIESCNELYRLISELEYYDRHGERYRHLGMRVLDCIDTTGLPAYAKEDRASEVAVCLKEILDRVEIPDLDSIPDSDAIERMGGIEKVSRCRIPGTRITIARVDSGPQKYEYLFSPGTVDRAVDYFETMRSQPYRVEGPSTTPDLYRWYMSAPGHPSIARVIRGLPDRFRYGHLMGLSAWKWPGVVLLVIVGSILMAFLYRLQFYLSRLTSKTRPLLHCLTVLFPIAAAFVPLWASRIADRYLTLRGVPLYLFGFVATALSILAAVVVAFVGCNRVAEAIIANPHINPRGLNAQLIRITAKLFSVLLSLIVLLIGGQYLGIPVATLLASAGIGGIALALGAQDTLRTLFGTVMLMADKPFRVGERVIFKGYDGVVEDIGLRSTRLRLLTGNQVSVPNDELSRSDIENVGRRSCIRRVCDIHLPLETPRSKLQQAVDIIREQLHDHEGLDAEFPPRVHLTELGPDAFTIRIIYWYHPPEYWDYLAFSERFNFAVFERFESEGIPFCVPQRLEPVSSEGHPQGTRYADATSANRSVQ